MVTVSLRRDGFERLRLRVIPGQPVSWEGDLSLVDFESCPFSARYGAPIGFQEDPEEWARAVAAAYNDGVRQLGEVIIEQAPPPEPEVLAAELVSELDDSEEPEWTPPALTRGLSLDPDDVSELVVVRPVPETPAPAKRSRRLGLLGKALPRRANTPSSSERAEPSGAQAALPAPALAPALPAPADEAMAELHGPLPMPAAPEPDVMPDSASPEPAGAETQRGHAAPGARQSLLTRLLSLLGVRARPRPDTTSAATPEPDAVSEVAQVTRPAADDPQAPLELTPEPPIEPQLASVDAEALSDPIDLPEPVLAASVPTGDDAAAEPSGEAPSPRPSFRQRLLGLLGVRAGARDDKPAGAPGGERDAGGEQVTDDAGKALIDAADALLADPVGATEPMSMDVRPSSDDAAVCDEPFDDTDFEDLALPHRALTSTDVSVVDSATPGDADETDDDVLYMPSRPSRLRRLLSRRRRDDAADGSKRRRAPHAGPDDPSEAQQDHGRDVNTVAPADMVMAAPEPMPELAAVEELVVDAQPVPTLAAVDNDDVDGDDGLVAPVLRAAPSLVEDDDFWLLDNPRGQRRRRAMTIAAAAVAVLLLAVLLLGRGGGTPAAPPKPADPAPVADAPAKPSVTPSEDAARGYKAANHQAFLRIDGTRATLDLNDIEDLSTIRQITESPRIKLACSEAGKRAVALAGAPRRLDEPVTIDFPDTPPTEWCALYVPDSPQPVLTWRGVAPLPVS